MNLNTFNDLVEAQKYLCYPILLAKRQFVSNKEGDEGTKDQLNFKFSNFIKIYSADIILTNALLNILLLGLPCEGVVWVVDITHNIPHTYLGVVHICY